MKKITILNGIGFAIIASLSAGILLTLLPLLFTPINSDSLSIAVISLGYLIYLCRYSDIRQGKVVLFAAWALVQVIVWLFDLGLTTHLGLNLTIIWLVRSLYFHSTLSASLFDLLLIVLAGGAASWAILQTGSVVAAVWCFFLCQSLFSAIPQRSKLANEIQPDNNHSSRFQAAHGVAQEAVRKLSLK